MKVFIPQTQKAQVKHSLHTNWSYLKAINPGKHRVVVIRLAIILRSRHNFLLLQWTPISLVCCASIMGETILSCKPANLQLTKNLFPTGVSIITSEVTAAAKSTNMEQGGHWNNLVLLFWIPDKSFQLPSIKEIFGVLLKFKVPFQAGFPRVSCIAVSKFFDQPPTFHNIHYIIVDGNNTDEDCVG